MLWLIHPMQISDLWPKKKDQNRCNFFILTRTNMIIFRNTFDISKSKFDGRLEIVESHPLPNRIGHSKFKPEAPDQNTRNNFTKKPPCKTQTVFKRSSWDCSSFHKQKCFSGNGRKSTENFQSNVPKDLEMLLKER